MIPFFTFPYQDEILYSVVARYHYYCGNKSFRDTLGELFGSRTIIPSLLFPSRLGNFASRVSCLDVISWEQYLEKNTMLPFYAPFMPNEKLEEIKASMKNGDGKGIHTKVGFVASSLCKTSGIKYCPVCVSKDIEDCGEPYFHRTHQLQGIFVCPKHSCLLKEYPTTKNDFSRIGFIRLKAENLDLTVNFESEELSKQLIRIAQAGNELGQIPLKFNIDMVQKRYYSLLDHDGYVTPGGSIKQRQLSEKFRKYYGDTLLEKLESRINWDPNWLQMITRKPKVATHPIRHLLLILFLCKSVGDFIQHGPKLFAPFGDAPWLCLNQAANHYQEPVITQCIVTSDSKTRVPVGTFSCSCGFVYSRKGPDLTEKDKFRIGRVKQYGDVWVESLRSYIDGGMSGQRQLAKVMGCDPKTILHYADKLNLLSYLNTLKKDGEQVFSYSKITTDISRSNSFSRGVSKKPKMARLTNTKRGVNWLERDRGIVNALEEAKEELLIREEPVRITRSLLGRSIGRLPLLEHYINKLPQTKEYLDCETESIEEFQLRRLRTIYRDNLEQGHHLRPWELTRMAGLKSGYSERIEEIIDVLTEN